MDLLIKATDINVEFAGREVLGISSLEIFEHDRIGLVGRNGAGKSTLLKVLTGEFTPPGCKLQRLGSFAYIPQLEGTVSGGEQDPALMGKLGISRLESPNMSGGEETRLKIAQALSEQAHCIFADEPTCHLDRRGIEFLTGQLRSFSGAFVVISHDRDFLDRVVDKIWELEGGQIAEYWGNYSDYLRQKEEERRNQAVKYQQFIDERSRLQRAADDKYRKAQAIDERPKNITADRKSVV
jgi:macrolide transport system ATP-binding/permease protein